MKKLVIIASVFLNLLLLSGCETQQKITVLVPAGTPHMAQALVQDTPPSLSGFKVEVDVVFGPTPLVAAFTTQSHDMIYAPINLGARLAQSKYTFVATATSGNLFLATAEGDSLSLEDLEGKTIMAFGQTQMPDFILQIIVNTLSLDLTIEYLPTANDAQAFLVLNPDAIVLLSEPSVTVLETELPLQTIDLQQVWTSEVDSAIYPLAGLFIKNTLLENHSEFVSAYLNRLEASIQMIQDSPEIIADIVNQYDDTYDTQTIISMLERTYFNFQTAQEAKPMITFLFQKIIDLGGHDFVGGELPAETFYYQP